MNGFRLSPQQRRLLRSDGGTSSQPYRTQASFQLSGRLDPQRLGRSLDRLVERHEILRTAFPPVPGLALPLQAPVPSLAVQTSVIDLSATSPADSADQLTDLARTDRLATLDLSSPALLEVRLACLGADEHRLIWTQPSLYGDRRSVATLVRELVDHYGDDGGNDAAEPMQYADLAEWLNEILDEPVAEATDYWHRQAAASSSAPFPLARRVGDGGFRPESREIRLPRATIDGLRARAATLDGSAETLLHALWSVLLKRYTDSETLHVQTLFEGRSYEGLEDAPGLFARYLPILVETRPEVTLDQLTLRLAAQATEAGEWQEYYGGPRSETTGDQTTYGFSYFEAAPAEHAGLRVRPLWYRSTLEPHLLELSCLDQGEGLDLEIVFDATRLSSQVVDGMAASFAALSADAIDRPTRPIDRLLLMDPKTRQRLSEQPEAPLPAPPQVTDAIAAGVAEAPHRAAVSCGDKSLAYGELWRRAGDVGQRLRSEGVGANDIVAVCCERSVELVVGVLGVLRAGAAYLPLDPNYPVDRLDFMLRDSAARIILFHPPTADRVGALDAAGIDLSQVAPADGEPPLSGAPDDLAYVIYTSGSTGLPKGVAVSRSNLAHSTAARRPFYDEPPERFLLLSSYAFDSSIVGLFWTLTSGGTLVLPEEGAEQDPGVLAGLIESAGITHTLCLPTLYALLLEEASIAQLASLRVVAVAGEVCPVSLARRHFADRPEAILVNEYGPTEATVWAIASRLDADSIEGSVPIGRAVPHARAYLLDTAAQPVPDGVVGEIHLGGGGVTRGYLGRPDLTAERFLPDPFTVGDRTLYATGDLGRRRTDGQIEFLGRVDHQVKIRGYRIEPGEIESRLEEHDGIRQAVVVPVAAESGELRLIAYLVASGDETPNVTELRTALLETLPEYMIPALFVSLEEMPLTPTGKIDRNALPEPEQRRPDLAAAYEPAATPLERYLVGQWEQILQTDPIGVDDNFFELGGNSIQAAIFMNRIRGEIDDFIHVGRLFEYPTVRLLASYLEAEHAEAIRRLGAGAEQEAQVIRQDESEEAIERIDDMSDDEVDSMLEQLLADKEGGV